MPQSWIDSLLVTVQPIEVVWCLLSLTSYWDFSLAGKLRRDNRLRAESGKDGSAKTQGFVNVWLAILNGWAKLLLGSISVPSLFLEPRIDVVSDSRLAAIVATYYVPIAAVTAFGLLCGATFLLWWGYQRVGDQIEAEAHAVVLAAEAIESQSVALRAGHAAGQADAVEAARVLGETVATAVSEDRARVVEQSVSEAGRVADARAEGKAEGISVIPPVPPISTGEIASAVTEGIQAVTQQIKDDTQVIRDDTQAIRETISKDAEEPDA